MTAKQQYKLWYGDARKCLQDGSEHESTWIGGKYIALQITRRQFGTGNFGHALLGLTGKMILSQYVSHHVVNPTERAARAKRHRDKEYRRQTLRICRSFDFCERKLP